MKHKDIAIAWLNGKTIQFKNSGGEWQDLSSINGYSMCHAFHDSGQYRIKPRVVTMVFYYVNDHLPNTRKYLFGVEKDKYDFWNEDTRARYVEVFRQEIEFPS